PESYVVTGLLGVGGGFLVVPALVILLRMPTAQAIGTSLLVIAINSGASLAARAGMAEFDWSVIVPFAVAAVLASLFGKRVAGRFSGDTLTRAFAVLLIAVAGLVSAQSLFSL
ncbi:MAG: sulfite exporter TauE/SafE family protein, partial [Actinomycetia bacterium]|nr:sulfite exporter TauE/SafE family protein [Actinomycetes bacterium]